MANFDNLKQEIRENIRTNGIQAITGQIHQTTLLDVVDALGGAITDAEPFAVTYGQTLQADIIAARNAGKIVYCDHDGVRYYLCRIFNRGLGDESFFYAITPESGGTTSIKGFVVKYPQIYAAAPEVWSGSFQLIENIVSTIEGSEASTTKYPSVKAVVDALVPLATKSEVAEGFATLVRELLLLDAKKADKNGTYTELIAGLALKAVGSPVTEEFSRKSMDTADGLALIDGVRGKSLVWNQIVKNGNFANSTQWATQLATLSIANNVATIVCSGTGWNGINQSSITFLANHKYYFRAKFGTTAAITVSSALFTLGATSNTGGIYRVIAQCGGSASSTLYIRRKDPGAGFTFTVENVILIDLTLMFGAGNEPTSVAEFEAMFPLPYYAHDAGRIINNATTAVEVRDSEDTLKDTISLNLPTLTGKLNGVGESVVVFPEGLKSAGSVYDEISGKTAIKRFGIVDLGTLTWVAQTLTNNELAFKASVPSGMTTDLSKAVLMLCSQYQTYYVSLQSWDDKGDKSVWKRSAQIVVHDSAHTTAPTEQDNWLSGVFLIYELAEPETYILDNPIPDRFLAYAGGTIAQVPENTSTPTTAPMVMVNRYPVDFHGTMESLAAAITSMGLGTMAYANGKFTFTPNAE